MTFKILFLPDSDCISVQFDYVKVDFVFIVNFFSLSPARLVPYVFPPADFILDKIIFI
jgi:hypothetical protein